MGDRKKVCLFCAFKTTEEFLLDLDNFGFNDELKFEQNSLSLAIFKAQEKAGHVLEMPGLEIFFYYWFKNLSWKMNAAN